MHGNDTVNVVVLCALLKHSSHWSSNAVISVPCICWVCDSIVNSSGITIPSLPLSANTLNWTRTVRCSSRPQIEMRRAWDHILETHHHSWRRPLLKGSRKCWVLRQRPNRWLGGRRSKYIDGLVPSAPFRSVSVSLRLASARRYFPARSQLSAHTELIPARRDLQGEAESKPSCACSRK